MDKYTPINTREELARAIELGLEMQAAYITIDGRVHNFIPLSGDHASKYLHGAPLEHRFARWAIRAVGEHDLSPAKPEPLTNADLNPGDIVRHEGKEWRVQGIDDKDPGSGLLLLDVAEPKDAPGFVDTALLITRGSGRRPENGSGYRWRWAGAGEVELVSRAEHDLSPAKPEPKPLTNADLNPGDIVRFMGEEWRVQGIDDNDLDYGLLLIMTEPKDAPGFVDSIAHVTRGSGRVPKYNALATLRAMMLSEYRRWCWARAEDVELVSRGEPEARVGGRGEAHPDDAAVDAFAAAMKAKLAEARAKGRGGWQNKVDCSQQRLSDMLRAHVEKGDPRDVANFACFLRNRGEGIAPRQPEARVGGEDCHCATCTCASGMTPAIRFDASPAEREGAVRDQLIAMGWTPPQQSAPVVPEPPKETDHAQP